MSVTPAHQQLWEAGTFRPAVSNARSVFVPRRGHDRHDYLAAVIRGSEDRAHIARSRAFSASAERQRRASAVGVSGK
jgi:hypothetical protein